VNDNGYVYLTPNCDMCEKSTPIDARLNHTTYVDESLGLLLDTQIYNILKIHYLFIQSPKKVV